MADVVVSAIATALAVVLLALAVRGLFVRLPTGTSTYPIRRIPGWIGLVTFLGGMALGHAVWR